MISIIISSYNRTELFRRSLFSLVKNKPKEDWELVVVDEESTQDILKELRDFESEIPFKLIKVKTKDIESKLGIKKYHNNPSVTNNIGFAHSKGDKIFLMGNEIIVWDDAINKMVEEISNKNYLILSTTYDVPKQIIDVLDNYGSNLLKGMVQFCKKWPLQSNSYRSNVTNYLSLVNRSAWEALDGYDERYFGGIACEDSDFYQRFRALPNNEVVLSNSISLHQFHGGKTTYYEPENVSKETWDNGVSKNREFFHKWDGSYKNPQGWKSGEFKVEVITNV